MLKRFIKKLKPKKKLLPMRKCTFCGKSFRPYNKFRKRCSTECAKKHEDNRHKARLGEKIEEEKTTEERNIIYNGYKEPFVPLKKEFYGYEGVILEDEDTGEIQCHICGRWFKSLASHLQLHKDFLENKNTHPITDKNKYAASYKDFFGLKRGTALVSSETREKIIKGASGHPYWERDKTKWIEAQARVNKRGKGLNNNAVIEKQNEQGTCYVQLLEIIMKEAIKQGKTPGVRDIKGANGQDLNSTIRRRYGSWSEAMKLLKLTKNKHSIRKANGRKKEDLSKEFLMDCLVNFMKRYKRTPAGSDFRNEILPEKQIFIKVCGDWDITVIEAKKEMPNRKMILDTTKVKHNILRR